MSLVIIGLIAFLGFTIFSKGYFSFQPDGKRYEANAKAIETYLTEQQSVLVDFTYDELDVLSGNRLKEKKSSFFSKPQEGVLLSIYHEPFLAFKTIYHDSDKKTGVLGVATRTKKYVYIVKKDHVDVFINQSPVGTIKGTGKLINASNKVVMSSYDHKDTDTYLIRVFDNPVAELKSEIMPNSLPQRIVDVFGALEQEEKETMVTILYYLIAKHAAIKG